MSPVHIDELNPETRAKALQQIGGRENVQLSGQISGTEGVTTALAASPAVQKSRDIAKASQNAFDTSMAYAKSIKTVTQPNIPLPNIVPSLIASLVPVTNLKAHPLSVRIYGEPTGSEELLRSIREIGVVQPIVIDENNFILAGTSRHFAAVQAGQSEIPAVLFKGSDIEREWLVLESNRQRVKLASQIGREYIERLRLESEFAKLRMVEGGKNKGVPQVAEAAGAARDKAASAVNLGRTTAERLAKIVIKADSGQPKARKVLEAVDTGTLSIAAAFNELESRKPQAKPADCPVCREHFSSMTDLKKHANHAHGLEATQLKEAMGFENQEKDPRHNQPSPYTDKSKNKVCNSVNSFGWTAALETIRRLEDITDSGKSLLMGLQTVLAYATGNTMNSVGKTMTDGSGYHHFRSPQEWSTVDDLISTFTKAINTLTEKTNELQKARSTHREKFLDPSILPASCSTGKRIYSSVDAIRKAGSKGVLRTFQCKACSGIHIDSDASALLTSLENIG